MIMNYLVNYLILLVAFFGHNVQCGQYFGMGDSEYRIPNSLLHNFIERMNEDQQLQQKQPYVIVNPIDLQMMHEKDSYPLYQSSDLNVSLDRLM